MSQLISELSHHEGRGKIATLLGIDIDEFEVDEDNATIIKHRPFETVILSNTTAENNSTNTKGTVERKLVKCFLHFTVYISHIQDTSIRKCLPGKFQLQLHIFLKYFYQNI
jgi:hypothetical protein